MDLILLKKQLLELQSLRYNLIQIQREALEEHSMINIVDRIRDIDTSISILQEKILFLVNSGDNNGN